MNEDVKETDSMLFRKEKYFDVDHIRKGNNVVDYKRVPKIKENFVN